MTSGPAKKKKKKRFLDYCSIQSLADDLYAALVPTNLRLPVFFYYALDTFPVHQCGLGQAINHRMLAPPL